RLAESLTAADLLRLPPGNRFSLPIRVGQTPLVTLNWELALERPLNLVLVGPAAGADGPTLSITVDVRDPTRVAFIVDGAPSQYVVLVSVRDVAEYGIASRGAQGSTGSTGSAGSTGSPGSAGYSASCPSSPGGNGGAGGAGGPGGPGGRG